MSSIITGAYDLHVHSGPDCLPRKFDDFEMAKRCIDSGMAGFAIKNHFFNTAYRARLVKKMFPQVDAIGMHWLNSSAGGLSPMAVEIAARAGTKIIGFPTVDTEKSIERSFDTTIEKPSFWSTVVREVAKTGRRPTPIYILDENGKLRPEVYDILSIIAKYNMVLATGHLNPKETSILLKAAKGAGVVRIIATHVLGRNNFHNLDEQKMLVSYGAKLEHCTNAFMQGKIPFETMVEHIKAIGPENCILCTDLGQPQNGYPDEVLIEACNRFIEAGIPYEGVRKMIVYNPKALVS